MPCASFRHALLPCLTVLASACLSLPPSALAGQSDVVASPQDVLATDADDAVQAAVPETCLPVLTGELIVNEVLVRPGGLDVDGDGVSNGRDEAIEFVLDASASAANLEGVTLEVDGVLRGSVHLAECVPKGTLVVLVGSTTQALDLPPGAVAVRLDKTLKLPDEGGTLALRGVTGSVLAQVSWPAEKDGLGTSRTRTRDGDRNAGFARHADLPLAKGQRASIGWCLSGKTPCDCLPCAK
jgi:hypothetical protein